MMVFIGIANERNNNNISVIKFNLYFNLLINDKYKIK
jgi:hypothetical protein